MWAPRIILLICLAGSFAAYGADETTQQRLDAIEAEVAESEKERQRYEKEAASLQEERRALQRQLVEAGAALRAQEDKIDVLEDELGALRDREAEATETLRRRSASLADSLAAMQRLSRQPTAALMLQPASITDTARTAMLLDHIRGHLVRQAAELREQVSAVKKLRSSIESEQAALLEQLAVLSARQSDVAELVDERKRRQARLGRNIDEERARQQALAQEAESLEALIRKLEQEAAEKDPFAGTGQPLDSIPFSVARGRLPLPAAGRIVRRFSQPDGAGRPSKGIYVETRASAQLTAPWDGRVVYAGQFRDYGLLLIIDHGEGYHTLLAGMDVIDVVGSQWILAGEPIGQMGKSARGVADNAGPRLYIELRHDGRSINPLPWLAETERKVRG